MLTASHVMTPTAMTMASQIMFRFDTLVTLLSTGARMFARSVLRAEDGRRSCAADGRLIGQHTQL